MFGTRKFRFKYLDRDGNEQFLMARNKWLAFKMVQEQGGSKCERAPYAKVKPLTTGHCQICAREIGTTTGLIAHHGYTRPGFGWQTASCFGARWRPYEEACDALPPAIESIKLYAKGMEEAVAKWLANPPAKIDYQTWRKEDRTVEKSADFDATKEPATFRPETYEQKFWGQIGQWRQQAKWARQDQKRLMKRLEDWKPKGDSK